MKWLYVLLTLIIIVAFVQIMIARSTDNTEQQRYSVLFTEGDYEIRQYPSALLASVRARDTSIRSSANRNFRRLAGYIFGGNESGEQIAMTAPVHMEKTSSGSVMSFVMPSSMKADKLPKPSDDGIVFETAPEQMVAVIRFSGFASDEDIREKTEALKMWLTDKGMDALSGFRYLGYNPPYQLVNRRNEVAVQIDPLQAQGIMNRP